MNFKIDARDANTQVIPQIANWDAKMTEELIGFCQDLADKGGQNFIIDLRNIQRCHEDAFEKLLDFHEECYQQNRSLVFTNVGGEALLQIKKAELHLILNIAPTFQEAQDFINMEVLEREWFDDTNP